MRESELCADWGYKKEERFARSRKEGRVSAISSRKETVRRLAFYPIRRKKKEKKKKKGTDT